MKVPKGIGTVLAILSLMPSASSTARACIKCQGPSCVVDAWNGAETCKTDMPGTACMTRGFCGGEIPSPKPPKPKPIIVIEATVLSLDMPVPAGFPSIAPASGFEDVRSAVAVRAAIAPQAVHFRAGYMVVGYVVRGAADESVGIAGGGHLFSVSQADDGSAHVKTCWFKSASGPMIDGAEEDVPPGWVLLQTLDVVGQTMVLALRYTNYSESEFSLSGLAIQARFHDDLSGNREYPAFGFVPMNAPAACMVR